MAQEAADLGQTGSLPAQSGDKRALRILPWALFAVYVVANLIGLGFGLANELTDESFLEVLCIPPAVVGALVASRQPHNPIGWILLTVAIMFTAEILAESYYSGRTDDDSWRVIFAAWLGEWAWIPPIALGGAAVPLLFPTGRLLSPRWRAALWLLIGAMVMAVFAGAFTPGPVGENEAWPNPIGIDGLGGALEAVGLLGGTLIVVSLCAAGVSQVLRYRRSGGDERLQIEWFAFVAVVAGAGLLASFISTLDEADWLELIGNTGWFVGATALVAGMPLAIGIAILRYRLYDIDWIINRTLVYIPLSALLAGVYIAVTGIFRTLVADSTGGNSDASIAFTTLLVVALLTPAKNYLQERVDRRFKENRDPARALEKLGQEARTAAEVQDYTLFVRRFLETTVDALGAKGGAIRLQVAESPSFNYKDADGPVAASTAIEWQGRQLGVLELAPRETWRAYTGPELEALRQSVEGVAQLISVQTRESTRV